MAFLRPLAFIFGVLALLTACAEEPDTYPVSGDQCGPEDAVKTVDVNLIDCAPVL